MLSKRVLAALAAVALAGSMSACSSEPGSAAIIDGEKVSVSSLNQLSQAWPVLFGKEIPVPNALATLIYSRVNLQLLRDKGVVVSRDQAIADVREYVKQVQDNLRKHASAGSEDVNKYPVMHIDAKSYVPSPALIEAWKSQVASQQEEKTTGHRWDASKTVISMVASGKIKINPRFGRITSDGQLLPVSYPWISQTPSSQSSTEG